MSETPKHLFAVHPSRHFPTWLDSQNISLAITTYQLGKLMFLGLNPDGRVRVFERSLQRCMGVTINGDELHVAALSQIWRFRNVMADPPGAPPNATYNEYDAVYAPRRSWVTGDLDVHDIAVMRDGRPIFVNTLYSCLATIDEKHSFVPLWHPKFISRLAAEDRCHMNGLAMDGDGNPRYVSLVGASDVADGWRERRVSGGQIIDIPSGEVVAHGLSMPHSPRLHRGVLYVLNSGTGEFGRVDLASGRFEPMAFCPGFLRGMALIDDFALVGLSLPREKRTFQGLPLDGALSSRGAEPRSGVMVIDLRTGDAVHWFRFEGEVKELYDVAIVPGRRSPAAVGFIGPDIGNVISMGDMAEFPD